VTSPYAECFRQMSTITSVDDIIRLYTGDGIDAACPWQTKETNDVKAATLSEQDASIARQLGMTSKNVQQAKQLTEVRDQHAQHGARPLTDAEQVTAALGIKPVELAEFKADVRTFSEKVTAKFAGKS
jgi:hypothetical protein